MQIPKGQKDTTDLTVFFALSGSARSKAACKMLVNLTPGQPKMNVAAKIYRKGFVISFNLRFFQNNIDRFFQTTLDFIVQSYFIRFECSQT